MINKNTNNGVFMIRFNINKNYSRNITPQIVEQISTAIERNELKKGEVLPSERALAETLGVSRVTVRKAYKILENNRYIVSRKGSHYYVAGISDQNDIRKKYALQRTEQYVNELTTMNFTPDEIRIFLNLNLRSHESKENTIKVAIIECRTDVLYTFKRQLEYIPNLDISVYLINDVVSSIAAAEEVETFDIVLTTASHYYDVCKAVPSLKPRLIEVVSSWSEKTIFELASIRKTAKIGIVYSSPRTISLIESALIFFNIEYKSLSAFNENNIREFKNFCSSKTILIGEPLSIIFNEDIQKNFLKTFLEKGGQIICFDHFIDKGSLMTVEKAISQLMDQKNNYPINPDLQ